MHSSNGSRPQATRSVEQRVHSTFQRMSRQAGRLVKSAEMENVHKFRTHSRRIEALVSELGPGNSNQKKLLKLLSKLRKKAGKVRDLDVQIAFLKNLRVPDRHNHRAQFLDTMAEEQSRRSKKLQKGLRPETIAELRKRLRRVQPEMHLADVDPLKLAYKRLPRPGSGPLNEKMLHVCRIEAKRARYLAELAPESEDSKRFIDELKRAQDSIGEWHDALKLKQAAEKQFGDVHDSPLVAVLQNISRAKFRHAMNTLFSALSALSQGEPGSPEAPQRKAAASEVAQRAAVA